MNPQLATDAFYDKVVASAVSYVHHNVSASSTGTFASSQEKSQDLFMATDVIFDMNENGAVEGCHVRLDRFYLNLTVFGGDSVVHLKGSECQTLTSIDRTFDQPLNLDVSTFIQQNIGIENHRELVIYARGGAKQKSAVLAWDTMMSGIAPDNTPLVVHEIRDAVKGTLLEKYSDTKTFMNTGWPQKPLRGVLEMTPTSTSALETQMQVLASVVGGIGNTLYSGQVHTLVTTLESGVYYLKDGYRNGHYTTNMKNNTSGTGITFTDKDNIWGNSRTSDFVTAATDAHYGHQVTFEYYLNIFGRQGIWNSAKGAFSRVHYGKKYDNAFWDGSKTTYGDGGTKFKPLVALGVVGHELTHGVTEATCNLIYSGESGGLNEATSDIFGTMIRFYGGTSPDWLIGAEIVLQSGLGRNFLRSMIQPSSDGTSWDCYCNGIGNSNVHASSGVANHFFYLLSEGTVMGVPSRTCNPWDCKIASGGGTLTGIGKAKAAAIWYRALTRYFTTSTNYSNARRATIYAATDLYPGGAEVEGVKSAWTAVRVY